METPQNLTPTHYVDKKDQTVAVKGAGILPLIRDAFGNLYAILPVAIVEDGWGQNGSTPVFITPSQDAAYDGETAIDMAARAEELQIVGEQWFAPDKVKAAIEKARCALPGAGLMYGTYGTMTYIAQFDAPFAKVHPALLEATQKIETAMSSTDDPTSAYEALFPTTAAKERSDRIVNLDIIPLMALLAATKAAHTRAQLHQSLITSPVPVPPYGALASYVARTLALHMDTLENLK